MNELSFFLFLKIQLFYYDSFYIIDQIKEWIVHAPIKMKGHLKL